MFRILRSPFYITHFTYLYYSDIITNHYTTYLCHIKPCHTGCTVNQTWVNMWDCITLLWNMNRKRFLNNNNLKFFLNNHFWIELSNFTLMWNHIYISVIQTQVVTCVVELITWYIICFLVSWVCRHPSICTTRGV